ncbi:3'-5' exonuclease [Aneurinibacillus sp. UBA3580]|jgi:DNA polymerase-3 subunit epsilon|uniref:3'-5' exonuclease n=1 Tax=Aneurinibacillus sp. UBA3580 TaxID=1946041 RepID=UPI00257F275C|nr:exonuclease domain-containing protein [Aneurinibacillus sp. UBA3580]
MRKKDVNTVYSFPLGKYLKHITTSWYKEKLPLDPQLIQEVQSMCESVQQHNYPDRHLRNMRFVVFDTETTGFHPYAGDEIISIGAVVIQNGQIQESEFFHEYIHPGKPIPPIVTEITGITDEDVQEAPLPLPVLHKFLRFVDDSYLVAHCADFDINFLNSKLRKLCKAKIHNPVIDTMTLAYHLLPTNQSYGLDTLLQQYKIEVEGRHTALGDAFMTAELYLAFIEELERRGIHTLHSLENYIKSMHLLRQRTESGYASL